MIAFKTLILALAIVESGLNPQAIGDDGQAVGLLQIHKCVVQDVNNFYRARYEPDDRFNPEKSKIICYYYLKYWGEVYKKKTGKQPDARIYAQIWNGGPYAWRKNDPVVKKRLATYWEKVNNQLQQHINNKTKGKT